MIIKCDAAQSWQLLFQDSATPIMEGIVDLHNNIMWVLIAILTFILYMLIVIIKGFGHNSSHPLKKIVALDPAAETAPSHGAVIEIIWTIIPSLILAWIAIPSFALLYGMDETIDPSITVKAIGRQWYWSYEYSDEIGFISFDSYMIPESDLEKGQLRLLEVDNPLVLPTNTHIRVLVTASDVLHSWAIPSLGVKMDAVPGRLNQTSIFIKRPGTFYGQCSELCGVNHGFMPIKIKAMPFEEFYNWAISQ
jgi:cytochrome c oxidase subunit 2